MSKAVIRSEWGLILPVIRQQLCAILEWPPERVFPADPRRVKEHPQGDGYLILWVDNSAPDRPVFEGAGRGDTRITERLVVTVRTRYGADNANELESWLLDPVLGHAVARKMVWDAMIAFPPSDAAGDLDGSVGNWLVTEPIKPSNGSRASMLSDPDWGESSLDFDVTYELALTQSRQ